MTAFIDIIGTDPLYEEINDVSGYLEDISDWCQSNWESEIEEGDSDYSANYNVHTDIKVDSSAFVTDQGNTIHTLEGRRFASQSYLEDNWNLFDSSTAILIVDYHPYYPGTYGTSSPGGAGDTDKVCLADAYIDLDEGFSGFHDRVGMNGTCQHEILHQFGVLHKKAFVNNSGDTSLIGRESKSFNCYDNGEPQERTSTVSICSRGVVTSHIDSL